MNVMILGGLVETDSQTFGKRQLDPWRSHGHTRSNSRKPLKCAGSAAGLSRFRRVSTGSSGGAGPQRGLGRMAQSRAVRHPNPGEGGPAGARPRRALSIQQRRPPAWPVSATGAIAFVALGPSVARWDRETVLARSPIASWRNHAEPRAERSGPARVIRAGRRTPGLGWGGAAALRRRRSRRRAAC
jgi:hypothetical protein